LRHAYGALGSTATGQLLAGQTWTNFQDTNASQESMDYTGSAGRVFGRQVQVRYTKDIGNVTASASIEAPVSTDNTSTTTTSFTSVGTGTAATSRNSLPDVTLRADYKYASDGYVAFRSVLSELNYDRVSGSSNNTASKFAYAFGVSGKQTTSDKNNVRYDINYGRGLGRYIYDINSASNYVSTTGSVDEQQFFAATTGYQHYWTNTLRSNFFGGYVRNVNESSFTNQLTGTAANAVNKYVASGHANLIWQPDPAYSVGFEYMHGYRKLQTGVEGNLNRVETSFQYNF